MFGIILLSYITDHIFQWALYFWLICTICFVEITLHKLSCGNCFMQLILCQIFYVNCFMQISFLQLLFVLCSLVQILFVCWGTIWAMIIVILLKFLSLLLNIHAFNFKGLILQLENVLQVTLIITSCPSGPHTNNIEI